MEKALTIRKENTKRGADANTFYKLFWIYIICGTLGFVIETIWCWIDFRHFSSRTSDLFFPISWVWGLGGVILYLATMKNRWNHGLYIFLKCACLSAGFEFLCGYLGEYVLEVTFWDYSAMPLHIGRFVNLPFCFMWRVFGIIWVRKICPVIDQKCEKPEKTVTQWILKIFLMFILLTQLITGIALFRMHTRQLGKEADSRIDYVLDHYFSDQMLQSFFPKMKGIVPGK